MDRGIKIAILVACVLSLGFGLIWDKVIDGARSVIKAEPDPTGMGPTPATIRAGDMNTPLPVQPQKATDAASLAATPAAAPSGAAPASTKPGASSVYVPGGTYTVRDDDNLWNIAVNVCREKERVPKLDKRMQEWRDANKGLNLEKIKGGMVLNIPK